MEFPSESRQLCHGISFSHYEPAPSLSLRRGSQWSHESLSVNRTLRLQVSDLKFCLGYITMNPDGSRNNFPCPKNKAVRTGSQCDRCRRLDHSKFMHHFHTTGEAPAGMRKYLEQPHFLYVASFAHGATKVGTTSTQSKWSRLAQQGAVVARYIAGAADGAAVRVLEDLITEHVGLGQQVRQKSKVKGLTSWELNLASLDEINDAAAAEARNFLSAQRGLETYGIELRDEQWEQPEYAQRVVEAWDAHSLHPWDQEIADNQFNIRVRGVLGQTIMVDSGPATTLRLIDAAELKTHELDVADERGDFHEEQSALF
ncbi:DUF2797 domain-containing protein [Glutamicibacter protophormiae]|uniref:DUF2797 domain-containing protein n=1 Tax=Glutamicibacter protophormiae TaxID=37930 RepID=UPI002A80AEBC|nr:DUF2797 domain-containing protein [Glutamicibacter protophormiae]WPR63710.1 DUF2797 domain-containing protein [Glutamicibacter protophormiae]WPR67205.1 DUF2797 domain-containing protein [Glutamicibacter protophormiae]